MAFEYMTVKQRKAANRVLAVQNEQQGLHLQLMPKESYVSLQFSGDVVEVWRNYRFLVCVYAEKDGAQRVSINRTMIEEDTGQWVDGITWDELQEIKRQIGRGGAWAVEVYPSDESQVNVANMRHLWLLPAAPAFAWGKKS